MSWDAYITNLLATNYVTEGVILGHNGSVWAASPGLKIQPAEITALIAGFKENSPLHATGVHINGVKYFTLRANDNEVLAKKGPTGIACYKTTQAIVLGFHPESVQPGQCTTEVAKVADYLREQGY